MTSNKCESLWTLMEKYHFKSTKMVDSDLICIICQEIMRNAHKSLCSCVFCFDCLERYSMGSVNCCPGSTRNCSQSIENVHEYLQQDHSKNERILNIVVKCPVKSCDFEGVLAVMENHISTHNDAVNKQEILNEGKIDKLITSIEYLKHEMAVLLKDSSKKSKLISEMRKEIESLKETNNSMHQQIDNIQKEFIISKCQLLNLQESRNCLENHKETKELGNIDHIFKDKNNNNQLNKELDTTENKQEQPCSNTRKAENTCQADKITPSVTNRIPQNVSKKVMDSLPITTEPKKPDQSKTIKDLKKREIPSQKPNERKDSVNVLLENSKATPMRTVRTVRTERISFGSPNSVDNSFYWKVFLEGSKENPVGVRDTIISKSFLSCDLGYNMRLVIQPNQTYLSLGFVIIKGKFDKFLPWPMRQNVNISLLDYRAENTIFSADLNVFDDFSMFKRPDNDWNTPYVVDDFIKLNSIFNNGQLYKNNYFMIRCVVGRLMNSRDH